MGCDEAALQRGLRRVGCPDQRCAGCVTAGLGTRNLLPRSAIRLWGEEFYDERPYNEAIAVAGIWFATPA